MLAAAPLTVTIPPPPVPRAEGFNLGTARNPAGSEISLDNQMLRRDGQPWMPVMGEFHFSRYPETEWREELLKMKAGGIDVVATYVFWIHHEEIEGKWDWAGRKDLHRFVALCHEIGLYVAVRCGPWNHGEVRNGGIPDWATANGWKLRTDDPAYLAHVRVIYQQISEQLRGLLWKDGGPVIAVQLENEYRGSAEHLLNLKRLAREAGLDVPLYTRTGWPALATPLPFGEIIPLFGAYAEGFWDRELTSMPGNYWAAFHFLPVRIDTAIANEQLGKQEARDEADARLYPYLTCELGGGMVSSYHRRIAIEPSDVDTVALVKIGSGGNLPGYYMFHGGTNPVSPLGTSLNELQSTPITNWNDLPTRGYDFFAPLGEYGQVRPHYHSLRRLHLFVRDFGAQLAAMPTTLPDLRPDGPDDFDTLRWSVRSDGRGGFVFVNNHQRSHRMAAKDGVQFRVKLPRGEIIFPSEPITVPAEARFIWPFNFALGYGVTLSHATAQLICKIDDGNERTVFFAAAPGVPIELAISAHGEPAVIHKPKTPSRSPCLSIQGQGGTVRLVILDETDSLALWKGHCFGRDRIVLSPANLVFDQECLRLTTETPGDLTAGIFPAPPPFTASVGETDSGTDGIFTFTKITGFNATPVGATVEKLKDAGPMRKIALGKIKSPVAAAPRAVDFVDAAVWRITLPAGTEKDDVMLRFHYRGDVARLSIGGELATDDFYNGRPFEFGVQRHATELAHGALTLAVLPLQADAPIFLPAEVKPKSASEPPVATLDKVEVIRRLTVELTAKH